MPRYRTRRDVEIDVISIDDYGVRFSVPGGNATYWLPRGSFGAVFDPVPADESGWQRYIISAFAVKLPNCIANAICTNRARSDFEAKGIAMERCHATFPEEDGYIAHSVTVKPLEEAE